MGLRHNIWVGSVCWWRGIQTMECFISPSPSQSRTPTYEKRNEYFGYLPSFGGEEIWNKMVNNVVHLTLNPGGCRGAAIHEYMWQRLTFLTSTRYSPFTVVKMSSFLHIWFTRHLGALPQTRWWYPGGRGAGNRYGRRQGQGGWSCG